MVVIRVVVITVKNGNCTDVVLRCESEAGVNDTVVRFYAKLLALMAGSGGLLK